MRPLLGTAPSCEKRPLLMWVASRLMERPAQGVFLETGRLVLRQFTMSDADSLADLDADPDVMRFITGGLATSRDEITGDVLPGFMAWYGHPGGCGCRVGTAERHHRRKARLIEAAGHFTLMVERVTPTVRYVLGLGRQLRRVPWAAWRGVKDLGCSEVEDGVPHVLPRVEALDFVQLDLGVLGLVYGSAGNPPLSTGQTCGQVCASPGIISLLRSAGLGDDFAVSGLPEPDRLPLAAKHNGVVPAPHHSIRAARYLSDGHQMTRRDPLPPRRRELRCVPDRDNLAPRQDLAGILSGTEHDGAAESRGNRGACRRSSHSSSMPERHRRIP